MKLLRPFKNATPNNISQGYIALQPDGYHHYANDIVGTFGTFLVAPFDCRIERIVQLGSYPNVTTPNPEVQYGCGISMISTSDPTYRVVYWHCLEKFPVNVGDLVKAGDVVAQMGNTGMVSMGGMAVSVADRENEYVESTPTNLPKKGVHVHEELAINGQFQDPSQFIDWSAPINYDVLTTIKEFLNSISNYLNK